MARTLEKAVFGVLMVLALGIGSMLVSAAATNKNPMDFVSSIRVADLGKDNAPGISEAKESAQLAPLAKITAQQAKTVALKKVSGTVNKVELDNENGNVVYSVEVKNNKKSSDVKIDAGNGKVLKIESGTEDATEGPEGKEPEGKEGAETESKKGSDFEQDGIDHQFEGDEGNHGD